MGMSSLNHLRCQELPLWSLSLWFSLSNLPDTRSKMQLQKTKKWVSHPAVCLGLSALSGLMDLQSAHDIFIYPSNPKVPKVLFHGTDRRAWRNQACSGFPFGCRMENLMEISTGALQWISEWMWLSLIEDSSVCHIYILLRLVAPGFPYASRGLMWRPP